MSGLSFNELVGSLKQAVASGREYTFTTIIDEDDTYFITLATSHLYSIVSVTGSTDPARSLIDVHAGGAYGVSSNLEVLNVLATSSWRADYGGLWCRTQDRGTLNFGWRMRLPSDLCHASNRGDFFGFILGIVDQFGDVCSSLAEAVRPIGGGRLIRAVDPQAWPALLGGVLPPE